MIIPALDLIDGHIVRLYQGDYNRKTEYSISPVNQLSHYHADGANWIHLVDLSGAKDLSTRQFSLLESLITHTQANIQVGGGIRCRKDLLDLFHCGAKRIVIGSSAVQEPHKVKDWILEFGSEKIILALDLRLNPETQQYKVAISGWHTDSDITLETLMDEYLPLGLKHVLCTDISRDGTLGGANVKLYQYLCTKYPGIQFQSSGGVGSLEDIRKLKANPLAGVIVGRALLEKKFTLKEAISCWQKE